MSRNKRRHGEAEIPAVASSSEEQPGDDTTAMAEATGWLGKMQGLSLDWKYCSLICCVEKYCWMACDSADKLKLVDASFMSENWTWTTGMVLRGHEGRWWGSRAKWYDHCLNALAAKTMACRDRIQYAQHRGVRFSCWRWTVKCWSCYGKSAIFRILKLVLCYNRSRT